MHFGKYHLIEELGRGGMCRVFRAQEASDGREIALKVIREDKRKDKRVRRAFLNETEISLLIEHNNIVHTLEAGRTLGRYYLAMELVEGKDLGAIIKRSHELGYEIPTDYLLYIVSETLEGLAYLHDVHGPNGNHLKLVHNDVTPNNVIVSFGGRIVLGDLGGVYAEHFGEEQQNEFAGKLHYLSPECLLGEALDHRSDIFSIGVLLYEVLTGVRPFDGPSEDEVTEAIVSTKPPDPRDFNPRLSRGLAKLVLKALAHRKRDRFQTADGLVAALANHFSSDFANTYTVAHFMEQMYSDESRRYWVKHKEFSNYSTPRATKAPPDPNRPTLAPTEG